MDNRAESGSESEGSDLYLLRYLLRYLKRYLSILWHLRAGRRDGTTLATDGAIRSVSVTDSETFIHMAGRVQPGCRGPQSKFAICSRHVTNCCARERWCLKTTRRPWLCSSYHPPPSSLPHNI